VSSSREKGGPALTADRVEECPDCDCETQHAVRIELRTENPESSFSREPYRVSQCTVCETETTTRMNDA